MQTLDNYRQSHAELRQRIDDLQSIMTREQLRIRPNARMAYELLCELGEEVRRHLAAEDQGLYPSLLIHEDPRVKSIAWGFISGEKPLRKTFDDFYKRWLKNCDFDFTDQFLAESHEILEMVSRRIDREEHVLVPKLLEIGIFEGGHCRA